MDESEGAQKRFQVTKKGCIGCGVVGVVLFIVAGIIGTCVDPDAFETTTAPAPPDVHPDALRVIRALERARDAAPENHVVHEEALGLAARTADRLKLGGQRQDVVDAALATVMVGVKRNIVLAQRRDGGRTEYSALELQLAYDAAVTAWRRVRP